MSTISCRLSGLWVSTCREVLYWLLPRVLGAKPAADYMQCTAAQLLETWQGLGKERVQGLMQDRTSSHLLEVGFL